MGKIRKYMAFILVFVLILSCCPLVIAEDTVRLNDLTPTSWYGEKGANAAGGYRLLIDDDKLDRFERAMRAISG